MAETFLERALEWEKAKAGLAAAQADETAKRDALLEHDFADRAIGTNTRPMLDGRTMKCTAEVELKTDAELARACMAKLEKLGEEGRLLAARLFRWKPEVAVGEFKKLPEKMRRIADKAITAKTTRPSIRIEEKKA